MKILISLLLVLAPTLVLAKIYHAPNNFQTSDGLVVFADFKTAEYNLTYNPDNKTLTAKSIIIFETDTEGLLAFDLVENPTSMTLDGESTTSKVINTNDGETWFRIALKKIKPGTHTLVINSPINQGVNFASTGVTSSFWMTDLGDRGFLEAYLPANFEYDQYKMTMNIDFKTLSKQKIYTNGKLTSLGNNKFTIDYPETYTSSSPYYHTAFEGRYPELRFNFRSVDERDIPVILYASEKNADMPAIKSQLLFTLEGLEETYGRFLHDRVIVFLADGGGGMEYCGATMTDIWTLSHELTHSYFARGTLMPANGNAGWIDEAVTTWSDYGKPILKNIDGMSSNMAGNSQYRRWTHSAAYSTGKNFMSYLNYKFEDQGGLVPFLRHMIATDTFKPMTTEEFILKISDFYSDDLSALFEMHVYRKGKQDDSQETQHSHMKLTIPEMKKFL